jgi:hypothetical protein
LKTVLKNIATIQTGVFAKPISKGEIVYLQSKHFDENGELSDTLYPDLIADGKIEKHLLRKGDVLFSAKGTRNFAAICENENISSVASTSFFSNFSLGKFCSNLTQFPCLSRYIH